MRVEEWGLDIINQGTGIRAGFWGQKGQALVVISWEADQI